MDKWTRVMNGWYRLTDESGRMVANVERYRGFWNVSIHPVPCSVVKLKDSPRTLREGKRLAVKALADF